MACSESRKRKSEEYEMQLFGFHSRAVYATLKSIVHERIHYKIRKLCETIESTYKPTPENLTILKNDQKSLEKAYYNGAVSHLQTIENVVNKCIAVPSNVLLEEDKCQKVQYTDTEFENIKQKLEALQHRGKRATILNAALKEELQMLEQFNTYEDDIHKICNAIENGCAGPDTNKKMIQCVEEYKQLTTNLIDATPMTERIKYNAIENIICTDCDFSNL